MSRESNSEVCNCLSDDADVHKESNDVSMDTHLMESANNKLLNRILSSSSRSSRRSRLMTPSMSSLEGSTQPDQNKIARDEQCLLTSDSCSSSQTLESIGDDVDEIIKYARHNLEEAGKTLASLNENNLKYRKLRKRKKRHHY